MVPAGDGVRLAVHGGGQALRRAAARRAHRRQDPQVAGELHQSPICASSGRCRRPPWWSATGCGPSSATAPTASWFAISMIPFTIAILRYAVDVDGGLAGEPEEIALRTGCCSCWPWRGSEPSVPQSSSADRLIAGRPRGRLARWPAFPYDVTRADQPVAERAWSSRPVRLGCLAAPLDRRRRPDRAAHGAKPVGGQRAGVQRRASGSRPTRRRCGPT